MTRTITNLVDAAATIENAKAWAADTEKFLFCIDLLEMSASAHNVDFAVEKLEARFEELLK
jgi:hypothetical protein